MRPSISWRLIELPSQERNDSQAGLEHKKEQARLRAKRVRESAIIARQRSERSLSPGVKIIGSGLLEEESGDADEQILKSQLQQDVADYILKRGGFLVTGEEKVETLSRKRDIEEIMDVRIARVTGFHDRWGLDRKYTRESAHAHRFEDGTIFEYTLRSYSGYESRTYYVVDGPQFRAFAQHNFRKSDEYKSTY